MYYVYLIYIQGVKEKSSLFGLVDTEKSKKF